MTAKFLRGFTYGSPRADKIDIFGVMHDRLSISLWGRAAFFFLFFSVFITQTSFSQPGSVDKQLSKISPALDQDLKEGKIPGRHLFRIAVKGSVFPADLDAEKFSAKKLGTFNNISFYDIQTTVAELIDKVVRSSDVIFVENGNRKAREELQVESLDLSLNRINVVHDRFPLLNGDGLTVSVKENKPDTADIDLAGRYLSTHLASSSISSHASIMSTMIAGGGNTWHLGKGVAWGSRISSSSFAILLPDADAAYQQYNISAQNHSYGVGIENYYGADAAAYDASAISNPSLLHVFSSGNLGTTASNNGNYSGIQGFANLSGSFKMAKNILTIGATDSFSVVAALSSKGPAYDGRVKPDLVAFGEDGSSGAAALLSGSSLVLQQSYKQITGSLPPNALVRSLLINAADDAGNKEVDYKNGFGSLNLYNAVRTVQAGRYFSGAVANGGNQVFNVTIPPGLRKVKLTLVWNDPPASPNAVKSLINDLDLELLRPLSGESWRPWVLSHFPHTDSLQKLATRKRDSLNNVEQVSLENPVPGNYQFKVTGFSVSGTSQSFYIAYQFDSTDIFDWVFPANGNFIFPATSQVLRWNSSFAAATGILELSTDNGSSWQLIDNAVNLSQGYYRWNVPALITTALLKIRIGASEFISVPFVISSRTITGVGFNCPDSFYIYWNKIPNVSTYRIYKLGSRYLEPLQVTTDSFVVLSKITNPSLYYAVAPIVNGMEGVKSYTFNYTTQGTGCYIRSFLAFLNGNTGRLELSLGTLYQVKSITLEKKTGNAFTSLQQLFVFPGLNISFSDNSLQKGINIYRIRIELQNGQLIYSNEEMIFYFSDKEFIIYPNPVRQGMPINILAANTSSVTNLQVYNMGGQKVHEQEIDGVTTIILTSRLSTGLYLFRFVNDAGKIVVMKVLVQ